MLVYNGTILQHLGDGHHQIAAPEVPVAPGTLITAGSGALATPRHRLSIQVGGAPSGHVVNDSHALRAGR